MGDGLKLSKDKRHRSSSSLAGAILEGTRSERKLDIRTSILEVDDQFALAEARCDNLQKKIDLVKDLKRKRKLKKRSMTRVEDESPDDHLPFITVRTQPKKKVSQQAARLRRLELPQSTGRRYLDPATVEQHRMIGQVRGYNQMYKSPHQDKTKVKPSFSDLTPHTKSTRQRRARADGDSSNTVSLEVACGEDEVVYYDSDKRGYEQERDDYNMKMKKSHEPRLQLNRTLNRKKQGPRDVVARETEKSNKQEERPVVELFNKNRLLYSPTKHARDVVHHTESTEKNLSNARENPNGEDQVTITVDDNAPEEFRREKDVHRHPRRVKYRSRRYEQPTVASQMKQAGVRYYYGSGNHTNIPFIVSKSTAPSHNIGVNIQQVLNGLKIQQPLSGIPFTIAHHMGLGYVPNYNTKNASVQPSLDNSEMNAIRLGRRLLRLPSYKCMSYNRLLNLYREGDGMVSRFLRAISRPHYFYTSMYNLATRDDCDGATSKGHGANHEAKQSLAEYASLYREYEQIDKCIKEGNYEPDLERRKEELTRELAAREDHIRKVVQDYRTVEETDLPLRASTSTAEDSYRHSTAKLNLAEVSQ